MFVLFFFPSPLSRGNEYDCDDGGDSGGRAPPNKASLVRPHTAHSVNHPHPPPPPPPPAGGVAGPHWR